MNRLRFAPPFPRGVGGDHNLIAFTTHLGLLYLEINKNSMSIYTYCKSEMLPFEFLGLKAGPVFPLPFGAGL
jgi:hypothetical protein